MAPIIKNAKTPTLGWVILIMLLFLIPSIYYIQTGMIPQGRSDEAIMREESPISFWLHKSLGSGLALCSVDKMVWLDF